MIDVKADTAEVVGYLQGMEQRSRNLLPVMQDFGERVKRSIREGDTIVGLQPLKESTLISFGLSRKTWVKKSGGFTEAGAQAVAGRKLLQRSGAMLASVHWDASPSSVTLAPAVSYAKYQQFGTGPYDIKPRDKKALFWPGAAHPVKVVHHPGLVARPFMRFLDSHLDYLQQRLPQFVITRGQQGGT